MKVSLKWIKDYLDLNLSNQEISDELTQLGLEATFTNNSRNFIVLDNKVSSPIFNNGFGQLRVKGRILLPKPAASIIAFLIILFIANIRNELVFYQLPLQLP